MPVTPEDIANMALALLTEAPITSLDDNTRAARLINLHYDTTREAELMLHDWGFAAVYPDEMDPVDTGQTGEYQYLYTVPSDFLRPLWFTEDGSPTGLQRTYTRWSDGLRSDFSGPLTLPYIANLIDPNDWDALFTRALVAALALPLAHAITGKASMIQIAQNAYDRAIEDATRVNSIQRRHRLYDASWAVQRGDFRHWRA